MRRCLPLLLALLACSSRPVLRGDEQAAPIASDRTLYVDERALEGGDGSAQRPLRTVREALSQPRDGSLTIEISSGIYEGPFVITEGLTLRGRGGAAVLRSDAEVTVAASGGSLQRVLVQGGQIGVQVTGTVRLEKVELSGQRRVAVDVASGALQAAGLELDASVSETVGVSLRPNAKATLTASRWKGPYRRGIEQHGGELSVEGASFEDSVIAVHVRAGAATLSDVRVRGGREAAFLVNAAKVTLRKVNVQGHEYGLLAGKDADLVVDDFEATRTEKAGVALTAAKASITGLRVHEGGRFAAVQLTQSTVTLQNAEITRATAAGVMINGGNVRLSRVIVKGCSNVDGSSGDGVIARTGTVQLETVQIGQAEGAGVLSGNAAEVSVNGAIVDGARHGAFVADYKGKLSATRVVAKNVREGAFVAIEGAAMSINGAQVDSSPDGLAWVDCASGATLKLRKIQSAVAAPPSACIDSAP